ncbi:unnamed protein product [Symbiodinium sp. KB8]|nr:unnamed protein product [Symbiodinium sp. KB8]
MRLAYLEPRLLETLPGVFGAFKAKDRFRQIGDRRGQNSFESYLEGVSQELAAGFMLTRLTAPRFSHQLHGSTTDRLRDFVGLRAHKDYLEFATAAHVSFLEDQDILPPRGAGRVVARQPLSLHGPWAGVVIDDLFAVSAEAIAFAPLETSESERIVRQAQQAYDKAGILGSPEKDTLGQNVFTIAGAQIDSSPEAVSSGCVTVGSPVEKRLALSLVSPKVASCRVVSQELAAMLAGGSKEQFGEKGSPLVDLPARARQELVLLAALAPLLATNVAAPFLRKVVASDASLQKGAYTEAPVSEHLSANLWLAADSKGFYTRLDSPLRASLVAHGLEPLDSSVPDLPGPERELHAQCPKPVGQIFDCLVVGPGVPQLDTLLPETGLHCGPRIDASTSPAFNLSKLEVCEWLLFMLLEESPRSYLTGPPTLEVASCPAAFRLLTASALAKGLKAGVVALERAPEDKRGLESLAVNDLLASGSWLTVSVWKWRERVHINLLETKALLKTLRDLSTLGEDLRSVHVVDSAVTLGAGIKGRSSTRTLSRALKQSAALQLAAGLYPCIAFGPTRLNTADDPTRDSAVRPPCKHSVLACLGEEDLHLTSSFCRLTRPKANWLRLACLLEKRQHLLATFDSWLGDRGTSIEAQASLRPLDPLFLNQALVDYGRELYEAGKPYWLYSETVIKRFDRAAADTTSADAASLGPRLRLVGQRLLRIGEATNACRRDLVLPRDVLYLQKYVLLRIQEPKTRLRMARHQAARCEPADQDSELVRRRGRWASHRVMETYLQEVSAIVFFPKLPLDVREKVLLVAQSFESLLSKVTVDDYLEEAQRPLRRDVSGREQLAVVRARLRIHAKDCTQHRLELRVSRSMPPRMQPLSQKPPDIPWPLYCMSPQPKLETLLQLCAYALSCRNRAVFFEINIENCEREAKTKFSSVVDLDTIGNILVVRVFDLLLKARLAEEWAAGQKSRYQEELKGTSWETRTHKFTCLLGLRIRSLMLELRGTVLESVCMTEHQLKFIPAVPQAKREPEGAEDALTTWLQKFATLHRLPAQADSVVSFGCKEFSDMCDPELREILLEGAGDQHPDSFRFHLAASTWPLIPLDFRDGAAAGEPPASREPSQVQELAQSQQRCEELSEELAMAKAELAELREESTCPAREVQAGRSKRSPLAFPPETLLDAAEFRAMLVENATYKERCEQMKLRLDRAEADLCRKTAENQRLLAESARLRERCRCWIVAHHPQSLREERGGAATSGAASAAISSSGMEASSSQDSDPAERMGFMVVDDCASSVLSQSSWFSVKPHCFVTDAIFRTRSCDIDFFLMGKDLVKGSRVVAADNETILEVAAAPEVFKKTAGFDLQAGNAALRVTADHLVLVPDPQAVSCSGIYVKAGNLKEGDLVMLDSWEPVPLTGIEAWSGEQEVLKVVFQPDLPIAVFSCPPCILSKGQKKQQTRRGGMRHMKSQRAGAEHDQAEDGQNSIPKTQGAYTD